MKLKTQIRVKKQEKNFWNISMKKAQFIDKKIKFNSSDS